MNVTLTFSPTVPSDEEKEYSGNVVITTNAGDVVVPVVATTKAQKGIIYPGDFEDDAVGWKVFDKWRWYNMETGMELLGRASRIRAQWHTMHRFGIVEWLRLTFHSRQLGILTRYGNSSRRRQARILHQRFPS